MQTRKIQDDLLKVAESEQKYAKVLKRAVAVIDELEKINDEMLLTLLATSKYLRELEELQKAKRIVS